LLALVFSPSKKAYDNLLAVRSHHTIELADFVILISRPAMQN